ncbi:MAG: 4-hydroxy-3-methylbut-2-enyl diphosphate reductase [Spirochaetaceae bacterium]|jgi:(E)-4-hydroxy-3-methyl-but-2-enyl pyrophosphate reductase|nr:4-hydroxy-3-methylbut-2-enyl diphosphate reductase [Spirochaetaceae bacterium]
MIRVAATCGMCCGAKSAYSTVRRLLETKKDGGRIILYKKLLHNKDVIDDLERRGAVFTEVLPSGLEPRDIVVIRAHGETAAFFKQLKDNSINYQDCTCKKVHHIHQQIKRKYEAGCSIIIIGDKDHAEVIGSNGWCNDTALIINSKKDIAKIKYLHDDIFIIAQTTFNEELFETLTQIITARWKSKRIEIYNSLCDAQRRIHVDAAALAKKSDVMIVLGDKASANTRELVEKCRQFCADTRQLESRLNLLHAAKIPAHAAALGITAGASTPPETIAECKAFFEWTSYYTRVYAQIKTTIQLHTKYFQDKNTLVNMALSKLCELTLSDKAKYIRGTLITLGYEIARGKAGADESLALAAAYELLETAILVHDDVFDKAASRRGITTIHTDLDRWYAARCAGKIPPLVRHNAAVSAAICAGDIGFYSVNKFLLEHYAGSKYIMPVLALLQEIVITTIKGEMLDILLPLEARAGFLADEECEEGAVHIDIMKTASYTTIGPLVLGMMLGGAAQYDIALIKKFAVHLGLAFQLKDDLLDIFGTAVQGKPRGADIAEYKVTLVYACARKTASCREELAALYGKKATRKNILRVREIMTESGAYHAVEERIAHELAACKTLLSRMNCAGEREKEILAGFISFLELRDR